MNMTEIERKEEFQQDLRWKTGVRDGWYTEKQKGERKAKAFLRSLMRVT